MPAQFLHRLGRKRRRNRELEQTIEILLAAASFFAREHGRRKPASLYGSLKTWEHLRRQGIGLARCTVERLMRLMRVNGWRGITGPSLNQGQCCSR